MTESLRRAVWIAGWPLRAGLAGAIRLYRGTVGVMVAGRCRFHPSCSAYALEAIRVHGAVKGMVLASWRVLRCSPLSAGGPDPVPERGTWRPSDRKAAA
ncbi:MAG: membrane protein insertion efficiency factor YidD [Actinomycetota bacterium]